MAWEPYNYTSVFNEPQKVRDIGGYIRLPVAVALVDAVVFFVVWLFVFLFLRKVVHFVEHIFYPAKYFFYLGIPLGVVQILNKIRPDGKKIYFYIFDKWRFLLFVKYPKRVFYHGKSYLESRVKEEIKF